MGQSKSAKFLRGKRMRVTVLDIAGRPVIGDSSVVSTKGAVTVSYTTNVEDGEAVNVPNMNGEPCVVEGATQTFTGFSVEIEFCDVDYALLEILTGQEAYVDENGVVIGITESTDVDLSAVNFALEMWLGTTVPGEWGYVLTPFLSGGTIGDISVENGAISLTVTGLSTKNGNAWGKGPYNVEKVAGVASPLRIGLKANDHRRIFNTEVAPPPVYAGATPLLDSTDPAITSVTATVTGMSAALAPVPTGTDPVWYDFGDGSWDYAETGSYTHEYEEAGTYTVTAHRGKTSTTKSVVIA
jgi:hypothetical protein